MFMGHTKREWQIRAAKDYLRAEKSLKFFQKLGWTHERAKLVLAKAKKEGAA